jgi:hypothetical protein
MTTQTQTGRKYRRLMSGSSSRLAANHAARQHKAAAGVQVPYRRATDVDLDVVMNEPTGALGTVRVWRTLVMHDTERLPAREFAPSVGAEVWTLNGQTHVTRSDAHFKNKRVGLDGLVGHLLVEVELDWLSPDAKSDVITTGRHTKAQREIGTRLEEAIDEVLAEDDELQEWNTKIHEEAFKRAASQQITGLRAALRAFNLTFKGKKKIVVPGSGTATRPRPHPTPPPPISPLYPYPKDVFGFRMVVRDTIRVKRGSTASVQLEADGIDGYFDDPARLSLQFVPDLGEKLRVVGRDSLVDGRMRIRMKAATDAPITEVSLHATCLTPDKILNADVAVEVVEPATRPGTQRKKSTGRKEEEVEAETPPHVEVHYKDDPEHPWLPGWTDQTVGEYQAGVAHINGDYKELVDLRNDLGKNQHEDVTNVYIAPIAMMLVGIADAETEAPKDEKGNDVALHDHYRNAALRSAALSSIFAIRYMRRKSGLLRLLDDEDPAEAA